jgi:hypothetical protein
MVLRVPLPEKVIHYTPDDRNGVSIQNAVLKKLGHVHIPKEQPLLTAMVII